MGSSTQKTVMSRSLARALIEAGMEHFDMGGPVNNSPRYDNNVAGNTVSRGPDVQPAFDSVTDPTQSLPALLNPVQSAGNAVNLAGGIAKNLADAFTVQNGYQARLAPTTNYDYGDIINRSANESLGGFEKSAQNQANQEALAMQLLDQSYGGGPNPAQAALNQNTGVNVANTGALLAGQRGASANPALIARQVAQTGAGIQQNAVGQAATLQAQQQLAAQKQLQAQQAQIASQILASQGISNNLYGTSVGANNSQNTNEIQNYGMAQGLNQSTAEKNAEASNKTLTGLTGGLSSVLGFLNEGGEVSSNLPDHLKKMADIYHADKFKKTGLVPGVPEVRGNSIKNDKVPSLLSPGEVVLPNSVTQAKNAPSKASQFMKHIQEKKKGEEIKKKGYEHVAEKKRAAKKGKK